MGGLGQRKGDFMYHYVEDKEFLKRAQSCCSSLMKELEESLRDAGLNSQYFLVGSGARNMVTQNEEEPIDFDYNLNVISCVDFNNCKAIKELVRKHLNKVLRSHKLQDADDSTSSLTTKPMHFTDAENDDFSIDICIVTKDDRGMWMRLKHEKGMNSYYDKYYWNEAPSSKNYSEKADKIKSVPGWWEVVRDHYLDIKNRYLSKNDHNHPSFVCYIEAVNDVYNQMKQKKLIK